MPKFKVLYRPASTAAGPSGKPGVPRETLEKLFPIEVNLHQGSPAQAAIRAGTVEDPPVDMAPAGGEDNSWKRLFTEAKALHQQGAEGDREAAAKAYELLSEARKLAP